MSVAQNAEEEARLYRNAAASLRALRGEEWLPDTAQDIREVAAWLDTQAHWFEAVAWRQRRKAVVETVRKYEAENVCGCLACVESRKARRRNRKDARR